MAANAGRTNKKHVQVFLDDSGGTLTDITAYINNTGQVGLTYEPEDTTAFSDGSTNITIGQPTAQITLGGPFDTVLHALFIAINGLMTPLTLDVRVGIRQAWEAGEPQFGVTSSATSGYVMTSYIPDFNTMIWAATLDMFGATAPAFGTAAET